MSGRHVRTRFVSPGVPREFASVLRPRGASARRLDSPRASDTVRGCALSFFVSSPRPPSSWPPAAASPPGRWIPARARSRTGRPYGRSGQALTAGDAQQGVLAGPAGGCGLRTAQARTATEGAQEKGTQERRHPTARRCGQRPGAARESGPATPPAFRTAQGACPAPRAHGATAAARRGCAAAGASRTRAARVVGRPGGDVPDGVRPGPRGPGAVVPQRLRTLSPPGPASPPRPPAPLRHPRSISHPTDRSRAAATTRAAAAASCTATPTDL